MIQEGFQAQIKMILDKLSDAEDMLYRSSPYTEGKVQQTKINKETPSNGSMFELANLSDKVKGEVDDEPRVKAANPLPEKIQAVTDSSEACKHEQFSCNSTNGEDSLDSEPTPVVQQTQQSFVQAQANFKHAHPNDTIDLHPFMSKSPIKEATKQGQDCILTYESRTPIADREMASRLFLPPNFYNYTKREPCPGCIGCRGIPKRAADTIKQEVKDIKQVSTSATSAVFTSTATSHLFGQSANFGQLALSSFKAQDGIAFSQSQTKTSHKPFQGAGQQLFAEPAEEVEGQDSDKLHFEPVIPLPEEIQVVTGEEGLEVMFAERAKLYRFDGDPSEWKERGIGEVKLLRHPTSGRGRVLMRREQIKKLCANHNITAEMELKPNVGSDRSWVWYTSADYAEGEGKPEKLAIKFKTAETAGKFKQVFDELKELFSSGHLQEKVTGCELYKQFLSNFPPAPGTWSCEACYVENKAGNSACVACNSAKPNDGETEPPSKHGEETATATNVSFVESVKPNTFQNLNKDAPTSFFFKSLGGKGLYTSKLFTIGRGESSVDKDTRDDETDLSPCKMSFLSSKGIITPQLSTQDPQGNLFTGLPFGTSAPRDFTFRMTVWPGSPPEKPRSPLSHTSPTRPVLGDADGKSKFEPVISLPEEIQVVTGEEGLEVMFAERAKLYRFDGDPSEWKERGIGEVKLLRHPTSGRGRVLMRREQIKKLCANHNITAEMELKPNVGSDRSWVWYTSADYAEGEGKPEKLAIKFKTAETAGKFKQVFDELKEPLSSGHPPEKAPAEHQKAMGCELYKQFLSNFAPAPGTWSCEVCYVENKAGNSVCVACNSTKPNDGETEPPSKHGEERAITNVSVVESVKPNTFQNLNIDAPTSFFFQSLGGKGLYTSKLFTTGRGESSVDKDTREDEIDLSPSKTSSPSKKGIITPQPSTQDPQGNLFTGLPFGTGAPRDFTFTMTVWPGSPPEKPRSPLSHTSPTRPVLGDADGKSKFEPVISLPEEIQVVTGEEGLEVMFAERAKLYRFDGDPSEWKERGIGEVKLLRHPTSGRGRVLMRREQIKKLCANHNITAEMELKPNVGSDRSWVWYTSADYAEGEGKPEKLAIKFKTAETAGKFKQVFDELKEPLSSGHPPEKAPAEHQKAMGCELYKQFLSNFAPAPGTWSCEVCYVENKAEDSVCVACNSLKPNDGETESPSKHGEEKAITNVSVVDLVEPKTFQDSNKEASTSFFQPPGGKGLDTSKLFTIGREESSVDKDTIDDEIDLSPSKTSSPSKKSIITLQPSTQDSQDTLFTPALCTWACEVCHVENNAGDLACVACNSLKPNDGETEPPSNQGEETATATQVSDVSCASPFTTYPSSTQPFVLTSFGVPAMDKSRQSPNFGTVSSSGSAPFSFSETQKAVDTTPVGSSVFGGGSPEQGGPAISFGSFGTDNSPIFDLDALREGEGHVTPIVSTHTQLVQSQSQSSFPFSVSTGNPEIPEQKLFWQQPTGPFQFGQLETIPPLGGSTSWVQAGQPVVKPPTSQLGASRNVLKISKQ